MIKRKYDDEFKKRLVKLHVEDGRSMESIKKEYNLSHGILNKWVKNYREEGITNQIVKKEIDVYEELNKIKKAYAELEKENEFLKKAAAFFAKAID
ncbi:MAG: transposase [Aliarcobacter sp.]|jgi:transposase|nr:transposase [Aliarcobacter sp.]